MEEPESGSVNETMESIVRVTFAGFGGSLIGMARENSLPKTPMTIYDGSRMNWAASCMLFVSILELSRRLSPLSYVPPVQKIENAYQRCFFTSLGDLSIGGGLAGMVASISYRNSFANNIKGFPMGLGTGIGLGIVVGTCQGLLDMAVLYQAQEEHDKHVESS